MYEDDVYIYLVLTFEINVWKIQRFYQKKQKSKYVNFFNFSYLTERKGIITKKDINSKTLENTGLLYFYHH